MPTERVRKLLAEAAELPTEERAELAHELARTLPEEYDGDELDLDYDELDRRMESVRNGTAVLVPWEEARKQLLSDECRSSSTPKPCGSSARRRSGTRSAALASKAFAPANFDHAALDLSANLAR